VFFTLLFLAATAHADGWKQTDDAEGILIFEQEDPNGFLAFKASGIVDAPLHAVAAAILDPKHTPEWVDHLEEDRVIRRTGGKFLEYTHVSTPIVLKDRDFLCEVNVSVKGDWLSIASHSVEDPAGPSTSYVRGVVVSNEFRLKPLKGGRTELKGEFHIDPRGSVAKWIVNLFQHAWPKKAFRAIQKRAGEGKSTLPVELEPILKALPNP
jgi:hypothetical protein